MTSTTTDRRYGLSSGLAVKAPVKTASTANLTLSGEQTIDGVSVVDGDRVLAKDQSTASENGVYTVSTGNWVRSPDFDGSRDVVKGTRVWCHSGTVNANSEFVLTTADPITIGSSSIAFSEIETLLNAAHGAAQYLVAVADPALSADRVPTDTASVIWDFGTAGQAKATVPASSTTVSGIVELATNAETITGTDTARAVTPAGVAAAIEAISPALPRGYIDGCATANGTDATNDINFSAGVCRNSANTQNIVCAAVAGKQLDAVWAAGASAGMRSSSSLANGTWHLFAIVKDDGTQDYLAHDAIDPTSVLPSGYTSYRHIWSIVRASAAILPYTQYDDHCDLTTPVLDVNNATPGTSSVTATLSVPTGIVVTALLIGNTSQNLTYVRSLTQTDTAPSATNGLVSIGTNAAAQAGATMRVKTNTSAQVAFRASANTGVYINTSGWIHPRSQHA